ncbi:MAG: DUF3783 domain-containing protein [Spirochaetota bacterium]
MDGTMKAVVLHGYTNEEALLVMRAVKALGLEADNTAFATTTPTSLGWKVEYLLEHLEEEHRAMRQRKLAQDRGAAR